MPIYRNYYTPKKASEYSYPSGPSHTSIWWYQLHSLLIPIISWYVYSIWVGLGGVGLWTKAYGYTSLSGTERSHQFHALENNHDRRAQASWVCGRFLLGSGTTSNDIKFYTAVHSKLISCRIDGACVRTKNGIPTSSRRRLGPGVNRGQTRVTAFNKRLYR